MTIKLLNGKVLEAKAYSPEEEVYVGAGGLVIVSSLTAHTDRCLENLPQLAAPRLNLRPGEKHKYLYLCINDCNLMLSATS